MGCEWLTRRGVFFLAATLLLIAVAGESRAANIALQPSTTVVGLGSLVDVVVYGTDFPVGTDGGDFWLSWSANLQFVDLTIPDPPWDISAFDASTASFGYVDFVDVFSSVETPGGGGTPFDVATLTLRGIAPGAASIAVYPDLVGWSVGGDTIDVSYGPDAQIDVAAVPAPGTLPLLALSLGLVLAARTRVERALEQDLTR